MVQGLDLQTYLVVDTPFSSAKSLLGIINEILDFSKIEAGKMEIEKTPFKISEIIYNVADLFVDSLQKKNIEFVVDRFFKLNQSFWVLHNQLFQLNYNDGQSFEFGIKYRYYPMTYDGIFHLITKIPLYTTKTTAFTTIISNTRAKKILLSCNQNEIKNFHFHIVFS